MADASAAGQNPGNGVLPGDSLTAEGLGRAEDLAPGNGWAQLGAEWTDSAGWKATAEVGERTSWGAAFAQGWTTGDAAGVGVGVRW